MKKRFLLSFVLALLSLVCFGQNHIRFRLLDENDEVPIGAAVSLKGVQVGIIVGNDGQVDFYIPTGVNNPVIVISCINYETLEIPASQIGPDNPIIRIHTAIPDSKQNVKRKQRLT